MQYHLLAVVDEPDQSLPTDLDELLVALRARVEERRQRGAYPPGLEEDLEAHFRRIASHRIPTEHTPLHDRLHRLAPLPSVDPGRISTFSTVPGGGALHQTVAKVVSRQTAGVLAQVQELANAVWESMEALVDTLAATVADPHTHVHPELLRLVDTVVERLAAYERAPADPGLALAELSRRVERLEAAEAARTVRPWFADDAGGADGLASADGRGRVLALTAQLEGCDPVLELGVRGPHLLAALAAAGIEASGVDGDRGRVDAARAAGVRVEEGEPLTALGAVPDATLGGVVGVGLVEALGPQQVLDLVRTARDKLRPAGRLVLEGANPRSLWGLAHGSLARPDRTPVDPGWLTLLCHQAGFTIADVTWHSPPPGDSPHPAGEDEGGWAHRLLFGPLGYVVIARR